MACKVALVDFNKCRPELCESGKCLAATACPRRLLKQEKAFEPPMSDPSICRACGDCVRACPQKAVKIITN
jgi:translation initiation factor RLI1